MIRLQIQKSSITIFVNKSELEQLIHILTQCINNTTIFIEIEKDDQRRKQKFRRIEKDRLVFAISNLNSFFVDFSEGIDASIFIFDKIASEECLKKLRDFLGKKYPSSYEIFANLPKQLNGKRWSIIIELVSDD